MDKNSILSKFISTQGYKKNSPDKNRPMNVIPSNQITMSDVEFPVIGVDNLGNKIVMQPGHDYTFPGDYVVETPMAQKGGWLDSYQDGSEVVPPMFRKYIPEQPTTRQMTFAEYKQQLSNNYDEATVNSILQSKQMTNYKPNDIVGTYNTSIPQRKPTQKEIDVQNRQAEILSKDKYFNEDGSRNKNIISGINWTPEGRTELAGMQAKAQVDWEQLPWQDKAKSIGTDIALAAFLDLGLGAKMLKGIGSVGKNLFKTGEKINVIDNAIKPITTSTNNIVEQTTKQPWQLEELPGLHLKSTMSGSPLEKQLSKSGEININSVKAYLSKSEVGSQDKFILNKVLNEKFAGQNKINYNDLRKYVSDELIPLNKRFTEDYADYGINALGYLKKTNLGDPFYKNIPLPKENTSIVFSNKNKFGFGSDAHFSDDTLGHSRILVSNEEPDVMHILESQSDYYQKGIPKITKEQAETNLNRMEQLANNQDALMSEAIQLPDGTYKYKDGTIDSKELFESGNIQRAINKIKKAEIENWEQKEFLGKNHQERLLQENVKFAAENGQSKMRYPTSETAAKIEGYQPILRYDENLIDAEAKLKIKEFIDKREAINLQRTQFDTSELMIRRNQLGDEIDILYPLKPQDTYRETLEKMNDIYGKDAYIKYREFIELEHEIMNKQQLIQNEYVKLKNEFGEYTRKLQQDPRFQRISYDPKQETILKKYADTPKIVKKTLGLDTKIVTDNKGNTWYEFDIPENFKKGKAEIKAFQEGGEANWLNKYE